MVTRYLVDEADIKPT